MEAGICFLLIKDIEIRQLRCVKFFKAPVQHFGVYFCLGVYLLILKTITELTFNFEEREVELM